MRTNKKTLYALVQKKERSHKSNRICIQRVKLRKLLVRELSRSVAFLLGFGKEKKKTPQRRNSNVRPLPLPLNYAAYPRTTNAAAASTASAASLTVAPWPAPKALIPAACRKNGGGITIDACAPTILTRQPLSSISSSPTAKILKLARFRTGGGG